MVQFKQKEGKLMNWEEIEVFCKEIDMNKEVIEELKELYKEEEFAAFSEFEKQLVDPQKAEEAYEQIKEQTKADRRIELLIYLKAAIRSWKEVYLPKSISRSIYLDSMAVFSRFMNERREAFKDHQFDRGFWTWRFTSGVEYRIGELEYEMRSAPFETEEIEKEAPVLAVHIPSDARLTQEAVWESYREATSFFHTYFPDYSYQGLFTESWLLAPSLKEVLPPYSNILQFAEDFHLIEEDPDNDDAIGWIFGFKEVPVEELPETTRLEKAAKERLKNGEQIGSAVGLLQYEGKPVTVTHYPV